MSPASSVAKLYPAGPLRRNRFTKASERVPFRAYPAAVVLDSRTRLFEDGHSDAILSVGLALHGGVVGTLERCEHVGKVKGCADSDAQGEFQLLLFAVPVPDGQRTA